MVNLKDVRVKLSVGIASVFLLVIMPLIMAMMAVLYIQNSRLAIRMAEERMVGISENTMRAVHQMFDPLKIGAEVSTSLGRIVTDDLRQDRFMKLLFDELVALPNADSVYFGFAADGAFLQVARLQPGLKKFGAFDNPPPTEARWVLHRLDGSTGGKADRYIYLADWDHALKSEQTGTITYDPRARPWYTLGAATTGITSTGIYPFSTTGRPGLTVVGKVAAGDGGTLGVFGINLSLEALSAFLAKQQVGANGVVFIMDAAGKLVGHPDPAMAITGDSGKLAVVQAEAVADGRVAQAVRMRKTGSGDHFRADLGGQGLTYRVAFSALPPDLGQSWTVGVLVAEQDVVGPLIEGSRILLIVGSLFLCMIGLAVSRAGLLITRPISALIAEAAAIRNFDLAGAVNVESRITEVHALVETLGSMKSALRSFGRFIPKEVAREIVVNRSSAMLGGVRQPITVMFSDLAGFSKISETLPPEEVVERLSRYFDALAKPIHREGGVIDKFIGDAIMALWNAPTPDEDHVASACKAVIGCRKAGHKLNAGFARAGIAAMNTRFGLHTDFAVVGNVGSFNRMQFTALGAMVNLASRVEGMNKQFGSEILVTDTVHQAVAERFLFRAFGKVVAAGTTLPIPVFELIDIVDPDAGETAEQVRCRLWGQAFEEFSGRRWAAAVEGFQVFVAAYPDDAAAKLFLARSEAFLISPPVDSWDGALHFDKK